MNMNKIIRNTLMVIAATSWTGAAATHIVEGIAHAEQASHVEWVCGKVRDTALRFKGTYEINPDVRSTGTFSPLGTICVVDATLAQSGKAIQFKGTVDADNGLVISRRLAR